MRKGGKSYDGIRNKFYFGRILNLENTKILSALWQEKWDIRQFLAAEVYE